MTLAGKRALVTGGGRGIGRAVAERLAADGLHVTVCGRSRAQLDEVAAVIGGTAVVADLADRASTDSLIATVNGQGPIDVLINNAGIAESSPLHRVEDDMWDRTMEVNATAPFRLCRAFMPAMAKEGWGRVVTIASNAGLSGYRYSTAYCASKHAVIGMTRALAIDFAKTGLTINAVCPGWVDTEMAADAVGRIAGKTGRTSQEARASLEAMTPQGRMIAPEEVAHAVAMLLPDSARGIHGQTIVIDGGQVMK